MGMCVKKQRHHFADKCLCNQSYDLSSDHVRLWELDYKEGRALKNWCFRTVGLEKTRGNPLDSKEIKSIWKEINPEYSLEGLMLKLKLQYFGPLMWRANSLEKTLILGKIEGRQKEKKVTEEGMATYSSILVWRIPWTESLDGWAN